MGIFRPFISKGLEVAPSDVEPSDRIITPANIMTAARPFLAMQAGRKLLQGRSAFGWAAVTGVSDAEGNVARLIDKIAPDSGLGSSTKGAEWDPIADTVAVLEIGSTMFLAPKIPKLGKVAVGIALGHEAYKAKWAIKKNNEYRKVSGGRLHIPPTIQGKESMAEKFSAVGLAVLAGESENPRIRNILGVSALSLAITGSVRAEGERRKYNEIANDLILQARLNSLTQDTI